MKNILTFFLAIIVTAAAIAQSNPEKYAAIITKEDLKKQLSIIASAEMEGRETATPGQRKAAAYIVSQFKQFGLIAAPGTDDYQQVYPLYYDSLLTAELKIGGKDLVYGKDFITSTQVNQTKKIHSKKIVFVGYGIKDSLYDDYAGKNVKGKTVIMFSGEPRTDSIYKINGGKRPSRWGAQGTGLALKVEAAAKKGARAIFFISPATITFRPDVVANRRTNIYYPQAAKKRIVNVANLSHEAAANILGKEKFDALLSKVKTGKELNDEPLVLKTKTNFNFDKAHVLQPSSNVVGYIEGSDKKDEYVVLSAHYDHLGKQGDRIFYGADDDGSGTTTVIEMAKAFAQAKAEGNGPRRTIIFMTVSGEEKGLLGSQYYSEHPLFPLNKTSVDLNTDMVGRIDPSRKNGDSTNYVYVIGDDKLSSDLMPITEEVNKKYVKMELDRKYNDLTDPNRFYYRSDHFNFAKNGVPIIFYFNGVHPDYHRVSDTVDKINFALMSKRGKLIFLTAWEMANRDEMLKRDIPLVIPPR